jgi:hypothetical protein
MREFRFCFSDEYRMGDRFLSTCRQTHIVTIPGWTASLDLAQRRKGDAQKLRIARRLRQETTMTLNWIAKRLNMGAAGALANLLRDAGRK